MTITSLPLTMEKPAYKKFNDITGQIFGKLSVLSFAPYYVSPSGNKAYQWNCVCACGETKVVRDSHLRTGNISSCGCILKAAIGIRSTTHGKTNTPEYVAWRKMLNRIKNPAHAKNYKDRGITVCSRWERSFENFLSDMENKPTLKHSLDRINNNEGYTPQNCRWATSTTQNRNTRRSVTLTHEGKTLHIMEWSEITGIPHQTIRARLYRGLPDEQALRKFQP